MPYVAVGSRDLFCLSGSLAGKVEDYRVGLVAGRRLEPDFHHVTGGEGCCKVTVSDFPPNGGVASAIRGVHADDGPYCHAVASGGVR
jgi:hypothetical protein